MPHGSDFRAGRRLAPGMYDWRGELHVDEAELIEACGGDPANPADREKARSLVRSVAARHLIEYAEEE